ncbi:MAG: DUF6787 family protein [Cytophagales bacterium]
MNFWEKLKVKWNVSSDKDMIIIFIVFAISGSLSVFISKPLLTFLNIQKDQMPVWKFWLFRIPIMFISYYIVLVFVGTLFGQFQFFKNFALKTLFRIIGKKNT